MPSSHPVIVVPGVTATYLRDLYPLPPESIWQVLERSKRYERAQMHPDNLRYEAEEPAVVRADQVYEIAYKELIEELRYNLTEDPREPVPVYPFGYDWRHPLALIEEWLDSFVDEVIARTRLLRHYHDDGYDDDPKVNLVGHSMGGLVIAGYIERFGGAKVHKVASLASPFRGSFEAMVKLATGTANLGGTVPSSREREAARMTPSLYHLLPDFETGIDVAPGSGLPASTFDAALYQPSIIDTITGYVDRYSVERGSTRRKRQAQAEALFAEMLAGAGTHRKRIANLNLDAKGLSADRWLCVVGADYKTRVRMKVRMERRKPVFELTSDDMLNEWDKDGGDPANTGDGTVHFRGAVPGFLEMNNLVCVTPEDYGYWEIADVATTKAAGFHGILPNMNMLHRLLVRHFTGWGDKRNNTWGRPAPGVARADWQPAVRPLKDKS